VGAFGEKLRQQRERRGLSLDAISTSTKISTRMLRAIEDEHFDQLPGGVFNKGFVRAYARQVGLDEEEVITDYLAALRESQVNSQTILPTFRSSAPKSPPQRTPTFHPNALRDDDSSPDSPLPPALDRRAEERRKETRRREDRELRLLAERPRADYRDTSHLGPTRFPQTLPPHDPARADRVDQDQRNSDRLNQSRLTDDRLKNDRLNEDLSDETLDDVIPSSRLSFLNLDAAPSTSHLPRRHSEPMELADPVGAVPPSSRVSWIKLAAPLLLVIFAILLWALHRRNQSAAASTPALASQPAVPSQPSASHPSATPPASVARRPVASAPVEASASPKPNAVSVSHATPPPAASPSAPLEADENPPVSKPHAPAAPKPSQTLSLVIRAAQTSWISITADGQPVARETLIAPANTSVRATHEIVIRTGNAAGVSFLFNGKEIPATGDPGEVRTYTFDASGMRTAPALPPSAPPS